MKCLIVGRTVEDVAECEKYGLQTHNPSAPELDYASFDGDVISCHTIKDWSDLACTVEVSERVIDSARKHPNKVIVGMSEYHKVDENHELNEISLIYDHKKGHRHPDTNSGVFALWYALENYDEIYTVGINLVGNVDLLARVRVMMDKYDKPVYKHSRSSALPCKIKPW